MATASVTNTFVAGTSAVASEVNTNFSDLVSFLNNSVIHKDGSKSMTGALAMGSNRITGLATGTATTDAAQLGQVAMSDYVVLGSPITITTSGVTVVTLTVNSPAEGMGVIYSIGPITQSGVTYNSGTVAVRMSVSGATLIYPSTSDNLRTSSVDGTTTQPLPNYAYGFDPVFVSLAAGTNTIVVTYTRVNVNLGGGDPSGGTVTLDTGYRFGIVGMA